ncbi:heavy-metal-associated domain-containing protein [Labrenzia sp. PHM005]|uniref:heavy-metal-associated domain-containing protein n=1 Tax=Labrenzia sp. PHM005 TaxID=2590016 RepID=UPI0011400E96|nr:heavy-metal-associated domain-containing protein [Labrenzia sp. PHM005]QDG77392.1 heavy-metal-associated domain-containing protein [Labrenzia sp. PHM005]
MKFSVPDMSCGHCVAAIEKAITTFEPAAIVICDLENRTVTVDGPKNSEVMEKTLREAGYETAQLAVS